MVTFRSSGNNMRGDKGISSGGYLDSATVPASREARDYTARVIPHYDGVAVPYETAQILWQPR